MRPRADARGCARAYEQVKRRGDPTKFVAEVLAIGRECDLALLTVKDPLFWRGAHPIAFSSLPQLQARQCAGPSHAQRHTRHKHSSRLTTHVSKTSSTPTDTQSYTRERSHRLHHHPGFEL
eukprot:5785563-Pleurochrysis_carterae.AAC.1